MFCRFSVVPGITVDLTKNLVLELVDTALIIPRASINIVKLIAPFFSDGVGTDIKTKSLSFTVSFNVCNDLVGSISNTLTSVSHPTFGEKPCWTAEPTNPLPTIPILYIYMFSFIKFKNLW